MVKVLKKNYGWILVSVRRKLIALNPTLTMETCLKKEKLQLEFHGMPQLVMNEIVHYAIRCNIKTFRARERDQYVILILVSRRICAFCLRYNLGIQMEAVQALGQRLVGPAGTVEVDIVTEVNQALKEAEFNNSMTMGFGIGFTSRKGPGRGGRYNNPRGRGGGNARRNPRGNGRGMNESADPESASFVPKAWCRFFHGPQGSCFKGTACTFQHDPKWTAAELASAKSRRRLELAGRN